MSTLTKTLVILLVIASLFLCGIVVTYVANSSSYKKNNDELRNSVKLLKTNIAGKETQLNDSIRKMENLSDKLNSSIDSLKTDKQRLEQELNTAKTDRTTLEERVNNLAASAMKFEETVRGMEDSLKQTRSQLDQSRSEEIKLNKDLSEVTVALTEKLAQLDAMDTENKRLLEEKDKLERQLTQLLEPGQSLNTGSLVTVPRDDAAKATVTIMSAESSLQGLVTAVDGSLATISIGLADGVVNGMIFHVIRDSAADPFICDILISDVDSDVAAGTLQIVQSQPRAGDRVSTTW